MDIDRKLNILISGGWGYGNLGDDAILMASLDLISKRFPKAQISVMSYDKEETRKLLPESITVVSSIHRILFKKSAFKQLKTYKKSLNLYIFPYLARRVLHKILSFFPQKGLSNDMCKIIDSDEFSQIEELFANADIFIMSGGGYFNNWEESFTARVTELKVAKKYELSSYIVGQTLDNFHSEWITDVKPLLQGVKKISVRDIFSHKFLQSINVESIIAPDLVLSQMRYQNPSHNVITFIPAELPFYSRKQIIQGIVLIAKQFSLPVKISLTRLYNADVSDAKWVYKSLKREGIKVSMRIPESYWHVVEDISGSRFVISRNLHGLIIGYIGGSHLLCLNDSWKFLSFMQQINCENYVVDTKNMNSDELMLKFRDLYNAKVDHLIRKTISQQVVDSFNSIFE